MQARPVLFLQHDPNNKRTNREYEQVSHVSRKNGETWLLNAVKINKQAPVFCGPAKAFAFLLGTFAPATSMLGGHFSSEAFFRCHGTFCRLVHSFLRDHRHHAELWDRYLLRCYKTVKPFSTLLPPLFACPPFCALCFFLFGGSRSYPQSLFCQWATDF